MIDACQWHIYGLRRNAARVLVIQSDLLGTTRTRIVAPILCRDDAPPQHPRLLPTVQIGDELWVADCMNLATVPVFELSVHIADASAARDDVTRALDMVLVGV
ncbi:MAG: CcdB family protein [Pseudomonadota bacterium]